MTISSANIRGLDDLQKRRDLFCHLKSKKIQIYCLQDTLHHIFLRNGVEKRYLILILQKIAESVSYLATTLNIKYMK